VLSPDYPKTHVVSCEKTLPLSTSSLGFPIFESSILNLAIFHLATLAVLCYLSTFHSYLLLDYFWLCEAIVGYFWLLKVISPYDIIGSSRLYYHRLFVAIDLVAIVDYSIDGYWCLLVII
jgi:hypothetical protein